MRWYVQTWAWVNGTFTEYIVEGDTESEALGRIPPAVEEESVIAFHQVMEPEALCNLLAVHPPHMWVGNSGDRLLCLGLEEGDV